MKIDIEKIAKDTKVDKDWLEATTERILSDDGDSTTVARETLGDKVPKGTLALFAVLHNAHKAEMERLSDKILGKVPYCDMPEGSAPMVDTGAKDLLEALNLTRTRAEHLWDKYGVVQWVRAHNNKDGYFNVAEYAAEVANLPFNERSFVLCQLFAHLGTVTMGGYR